MILPKIIFENPNRIYPKLKQILLPRINHIQLIIYHLDLKPCNIEYNEYLAVYTVAFLRIGRDVCI